MAGLSVLHQIGNIVFGGRVLTPLTFLVAFNNKSLVFFGKKIHEIALQIIFPGKSADAADRFIDKDNAELIVKNQHGVRRAFDDRAIHFFAD